MAAVEIWPVFIELFLPTSSGVIDDIVWNMCNIGRTIGLLSRLRL